MELLLTFATASWAVFGAMAPYLLLGFAVAGLLSVVISAEWVERHLGGNGLGQVVKASLFGVPLPLCSCGVIPVAASLRQHGAGRSATTAFLLSTPQTGVDSILVTWTMLGPLFAIFRPVAALVTGLL
ncbi:MAG: permease, partial [Thermoanaerobaculales bacterium]|nr:permease [Thermoanaerobaculales bacterium]